MTLLQRGLLVTQNFKNESDLDAKVFDIAKRLELNDEQSQQVRGYVGGSKAFMTQTELC